MNALGFSGNGRVGREGAHFDELAEASRALVVERRQLARDFAAALHLTPRAHVRTPAWGLGRSHASVLDVIADDFAGHSGDASLCALLEIVTRVAEQGDKEAQQWIKEAAKRYAAFHAGEQA